MFSYLNCNELYLPISTFLSIYLPTYLPTYLPPWLILGFPFTTHGQDYKILFYDGGQSFRYKIVSIQVNLLVNMIFLENYLIKVLMQILLLSVAAVVRVCYWHTGLLIVYWPITIKQANLKTTN